MVRRHARLLLGVLGLLVVASGCTTRQDDAYAAQTPAAQTPAAQYPEATRPASPPAVAPSAALPEPAGLQTAVVVRHVDGDTLVLRGTGAGPLSRADTRVRLLQVDTPEVFDAPECYGEQASARTRELVPVGSRVAVQADERLTDRFGRTLLLVWTADGRSLQEVLLREGYATVLQVPPNELGVSALREVEAQARRAGAGLWRDC